MDIVIRNLIAVTCNHCFAQQQPLERMSAFKWQQVALLLYSLGMDAAPVMPPQQAENLEKARQQFLAQVGESPAALLADPSDTLPMVETRLCNKRLNRRLLTIGQEETRDADKAPATWTFFSLLVYNVEQLLAGRIHLPYLLRIGIFLRQKGHLIDYPKLETWLQRVRIVKPVGCLTTIITEVFHLTADEIPYRYTRDRRAAALFSDALSHLLSHLRRANRRRISQGAAILLPMTMLPDSGSRLLPRHKTVRYAPREALPLMLHNFRTRIDQIEE